MAFTIEVTASNESPIMQILTRLSGFDSKSLFRAIGAELVSGIDQRFIDQHDVEGNPWKQSWRASIQNGQTLRDTGRLMNSFTYNVLPNGVEVGTDVQYAAPLHFGAHILPKVAGYLTFNVAGNWRKVKEVENPARSFLGVSKEDEENILDIIGRFVSV